MIMKIFERTGKVALGSRLRLMTSRITDDAVKIYELYGMDFSPKWFPVFFVLAEDGPKTITEIANEIGHSQPSVTKITQEMIAAGLVEDNRDSPDKRRNIVALTAKGQAFSEQIKIQCADVEAAIESINSQARHNLWQAIEEWEFLLEQESLLMRVQQQKKLRESRDVQIVEYTEEHQVAFKSLNEEWISTYFQMEEADYKALDDPQGYILDKGGKIFVALLNDEIVGVAALIKLDDPDYDFEMAKMAVSPKAQGKSIGWLLGLAIINAAKQLGGRNIFLQSNTILKPAISLYQKLGFKKVVARATPYQRSNIQMELKL